MMKKILLILAFTFSSNVLLAQKTSFYSEFDTIKIYPDKMLIDYKLYSDSVLSEHFQAFFHPIVRKVPRFRLLGDLFKTNIHLDSLVFHGNRITYNENRASKTEVYEDGLLLSTFFYDAEKSPISKREFQGNSRILGPCGEITGHYFSYGRKGRLSKK
jgi:hypothetical protein